MNTHTTLLTAILGTVIVISPAASAAAASSPLGRGNVHTKCERGEGSWTDEHEKTLTPGNGAALSHPISKGEREQEKTLTPTLSQGEREQDKGREMGREMGQPEFTTADQLLDALEDVEIDRLTADVRYTKISEFLGEREMRLGTMQFTSTPRPDRPNPAANPKRKFGVRFDKIYIGNIQDDEPKVYVFDGHWFVTKLPNEKLISKREVVRPGDEADPLRIGEGPFPIPIGQKKEEILRRFDAELLDADDGLTLDPDDENDPAAMKAARNLVRFTRGSYQIRLTPKEVFGDTLDLAEVRLWYKRDGAGAQAGGGEGEGGENGGENGGKNGALLPRMARTVDVDGNVSIIELINVKVGDKARIDEAMFDTAVPDGWKAEIRGFDG